MTKQKINTSNKFRLIRSIIKDESNPWAIIIGKDGNVNYNEDIIKVSDYATENAARTKATSEGLTIIDEQIE